jgi:hypothetical protein
MSRPNPLVPVWETYQVTNDSLRVARRTVERKALTFHNRTRFFGTTDSEAVDRIRESSDHSADFAVLALWTAFERYIVEYIQSKARRIEAVGPALLTRQVSEEVERQIEYWKIESVLDPLKGTVDSTFVGHAKQIKAYRDWVVHRNPKRSVSASTDPKMTYNVLARIIDEIRSADPYAL